MIDAFSSKIIHAWTKTAFTSVRLNVMTHALHADEGLLPAGLTIQNVYTEMHNGSKNVAVVVRNSMAYPSDPEDTDPSGKSGGFQLST